MRAIVLVAFFCLVALASAHFGEKCNGKCQDKKLPCAGTYAVGLCPGAANIQCCQPKAAQAASKCPGKCQDKNTPCAGSYAAGLCPGAANIQCCKPATTSRSPATQPAPTQAPTQTPAASTSARNLRFDALWKNYPHGEAEEVKKRIGGGINAEYITNTCVIRVSHALISAGFTIPRNFPVPNATNKPMLTVLGANKKAYALRVREFNVFMQKTFGKPTVVVKKSGPNGIDLAEVDKVMSGRKGIIMFDVRIWSDAGGHFDLWDGNNCAHECYFEKAEQAFLWELH